MRSISLFLAGLYSILLLTIPSPAPAESDKLELVMIIGARESIMTARSIRDLMKIPGVSARCSLHFYTDREIRGGRVSRDHVSNADIVLADFMKREIDAFLAENLTRNQCEIYSLRCGYLAGKLKKTGFEPDRRAEKYYAPPTVGNIKNLIRMVLAHKGERISYGAPFILPKAGLFHPDSTEIFPSFDGYLEWYRQSGKFKPAGPWVGIHTFRSSAVKESGKLEAHIIRSLEEEGVNTMPVFGMPPYHESMEAFFLDENGKARVQAICGFAFRFLRGFPGKTRDILTRINAPIFIPLEAHGITIRQWEKSDTGITPLRTAWQVCIPEQNGAIEPTIVGGKTPARLKGMSDVVYDRAPIPEQIDFLIKRIMGSHNLKTKPNREKKIAILYWNHPPGKQNIGGSYMNCFRSIASILREMEKRGYQLDGESPGEKEIEQRLLLAGRNVGSWAPGELEKLIASRGVVKIPISEYERWFAELPEGFREAVIRQWGQARDSDIMIKNGEIVVPQIRLGNIILMPQPARGFGENPEKLYHDPKIHPHHQYIAVYLWLKKKFGADAIISLGKHGTHEWLPGKQVGLSTSCAPDVLIQDIPNIYPYIVDNVGEGIQAKRRGRGVIIDHLIPPLEKGGSYMEYRELTGRIDAFHNALATDEGLAAEKRASVHTLIRKLGLDKELELETLDDEAVEEVEHYILELQEELIPHGLHTFGVSPDGDPLDHLAEAICEASPEIKKETMRSRLKACGRNEIASLLTALEGGYVASGEGNDPVRSPDAVPTGKNFFGFNIDKVPSREAFALGKKLADEMIRGYMEKHGVWPDKLGVILWSTELQRNEGASVAAVFHLLGITPVWDKKDQVVDIEPIPGPVLQRPRIDVLVQSSGLFRDSYARIVKLLDRAARMAGSLEDVENFVAMNNRKIEKALLEKGYTEAEARELSQARVFAPMPGAYSHALQELIPNSGVWEDDREIADVFIHHYSFAYGDAMWGRSLESAYKRNLKDVKITMHTRSSNLYNMLDNDDMFAFLGGLSLAVKSQAGEYPDTLVADMRDGKSLNLVNLPRAIGKALRTRYLNPKWIEAMKKEGYSGARAMDEFVENLWGFQVTSPYAVDKSQWEQIHEVYIEDKYDQGLKEFFDKNNPWARQSISARMLEADRKGYWKPSVEIKNSLARTYAMNVIEKGVACCEHTCNNPAFQTFVTNLLSLAGLLTPRQMDQFKTALAKAAGKPLIERQKEHRRARERLRKTIEEIRKEEDVHAETEGEKREGFEMVEEKVEKTEMTSSGSAWQVMLIVLCLLALLFIGWKRMNV